MNSWHGWWHRFWKDSHGHVVIVQLPNLPLLLWLSGTIVARVVPHGRFETLSKAVAFGSIFTWAWLEVSEGVTYFRRLLGAVALILILVSRLGR